MFVLCVAVRTGNLAKFNQALEQFGEKFQTDGTYTLIIRLRHNVIKTGEGGGRLLCVMACQMNSLLNKICVCVSRCSYDQPVLLSYLSGRHCSEAAARQPWGCRVHRRQGNGETKNWLTHIGEVCVQCTLFLRGWQAHVSTWKDYICICTYMYKNTCISVKNFHKNMKWFECFGSSWSVSVCKETFYG